MNNLNTNFKNIISHEWKKLWAPPVNKILLIIAGLLILIIILITPVLNGIVKPKLENKINKNEGVNVKIGYVGYNIFVQKLFIENTNLTIKDSSSKDSINIQIPYCRISGLKVLKFLLGSGLSFEELAINNPHLFIKRSSENDKKDPEEEKNKDPKKDKILTILPNRFKPLSFEKFSLKSLILTQLINHHVYHDTVRSFDLEFNDLKIDSSTIDDSLSLKYASDFKLSAERISYHFSDHYLIKFETLTSSSADSLLLFKYISYKPYLPDNDFFSDSKYSTDRYIIKMPLLSIQGINYKKLLWDNDFFIRKIEFDSMYFNVCSNYTAPADPNSVPKMPNELMRSAKEKINIEKIVVKNAELHIKAKHPHVNKYSDVPFTNAYTEITNLSNIPGLQTDKNPCIFNASGNMFNAGKLKLIINIPLLKEEMTFNYHGDLTSMSTLPINSQIKWADQVEIKSGKIESAEYSVHVLNSVADVYVKALYHDLKIEKLKENSEKGGVLNKAATFLANKFKLRKSNPDDDGKIKTGNIIYPKEKGSTFLDFVWSAVKNALGEEVGF